MRSLKNTINSYLEYVYYYFSTNEEVDKCPVCECDEIIFHSFKKWKKVNVPLSSCLRCDFIFQSPRMDDKALSNYYRLFYRHESNYKHMQAMYERGRRRGKYISEYLSDNRVMLDGATIYEVGCGYGGILDYFRLEHGCEVFGSDIDVNAISFSIEKGLNIKKGGVEVFENEGCDILIISHVLEHMKYPIEFIKKSSRLIRKGGYVYIEVPGIENKKVINSNLSAQIGHLMYFNYNSLKSVVEKSKLEVAAGNEIVQMLVRENNGDE